MRHPLTAQTGNQRSISTYELSLRLASIVDSSEDAIVSTDLAGTIVTWNASASALFGYAPNEMIGQSALLLAPVELHAEELSRFRSISPGESTQHYHTQRIRKGGGRVEVSIALSRIDNPVGELIGASLIMRDVAEQKQLQDTRARFAAIVDSSDDAIVGKDLNCVVTAWNQSAERIFGYTASEMIGRSIMSIIPPELQHEEVEIMRRLRSGERIEHFETQRLAKGGVRVDVSLTISPIRDTFGTIVGASKIARDISDRRRVADTSLRLAAIVESSDDGIVGKNLDGIITSWNAAATRIFGYEPDEIIGHSVLRLIPRELHAEEPMILARIRAGNRVDHFESRRLRKDGRLIDVSLTISPIKDASSKVVGASKIVRDISERKRIDLALAETEKLAITGRMAATLAHEVNNPLEAIMNLAFLLANDPSLSLQGRSYAATLIEQVTRASEITRQTLSFYRGSSVPEEVYIPALLAGTLNSKRGKIEAKRIKVRTECERDGRAWGITGELSQLFSNLVENAIDAVDLDGQIRIRSRDVNSSFVIVSISDSGGGMSPETVHRAFEPFFTTKREKGTGLGLWVSRGIVRKHGGKIWIRTRQATPWRGTTISVLLPTGAIADASQPLTQIAAD